MGGRSIDVSWPPVSYAQYGKGSTQALAPAPDDPCVLPLKPYVGPAARQAFTIGPSAGRSRPWRVITDGQNSAGIGFGDARMIAEAGTVVRWRGRIVLDTLR
jgi:hypothetical protein